MVLFHTSCPTLRSGCVESGLVVIIACACACTCTCTSRKTQSFGCFSFQVSIRFPCRLAPVSLHAASKAKKKTLPLVVESHCRAVKLGVSCVGPGSLPVPTVVPSSALPLVPWRRSLPVTRVGSLVEEPACPRCPLQFWTFFRGGFSIRRDIVLLCVPLVWPPVNSGKFRVCVPLSPICGLVGRMVVSN